MNRLAPRLRNKPVIPRRGQIAGNYMGEINSSIEKMSLDDSVGFNTSIGGMQGLQTKLPNPHTTLLHTDNTTR